MYYISETQLENAAKRLWQIKHPMANSGVWDQLGKRKKDDLRHDVKTILMAIGMQDFMIVPDGDDRHNLQSLGSVMSSRSGRDAR
jgi:hypothetical protein